MSLLRLTGMRKAFGGVQALRDGALELYAGQVTALVGENGAGKSTLVKIVTGVVQGDAGVFEIDGRAVHPADPIAAQALGVCAMHQDPAVFDPLTVTENIFVAKPLLRRGVLDWTSMRQQARDGLTSLNARIDPDALASTLSIAEKHLVQLARALLLDARVVILDEPTASLSHQETQNLFSIVARLKREGRAVLFISHKFEEIFAICDRYVVLRDGATIGEGLIADTDSARLIELMVGRAMPEAPPLSPVETDEKILSVAGLSRRGEFEDVSLELRRGEVLGVYGLIGSGRSEVAQTLFGLAKPDAGRIVIDGRTEHFHAASDAVRAGLAYVPEDRQGQGAALSLPIRDNISLVTLSRSAHGGWIDRRAERVMTENWAAQLDVRAADLDAPMASLSGGNQQKVVLAKWLATAPRVLILDEPTKGVDIAAKDALHQSVRALAAEGMGVLLISSDLPEVLALSHRVLVMRRGRIQGELDRASATPEAILRMATDA